MDTLTFTYAKLPVVAEYRAVPRYHVSDGGPAGLGEVLIDRLTFGGVVFTREEAEALQFGDEQTLWDEADHRCWLDAYGPRDLPELQRVAVEIADAGHLPEFAAAMAHAKRIAAE
jgi:hypothetical protein